MSGTGTTIDPPTLRAPSRHSSHPTTPRNVCQATTGEKGIGFKSVFAVSDTPGISSNGFEFGFDAQVREEEEWQRHGWGAGARRWVGGVGGGWRW